MNDDQLIFNPPPGWPRPPEGWRPPAGWVPDPSWPSLPENWPLWLPAKAGQRSAVKENDQSRTVAPLKGAQSTGNSIDRIALLEAENAALRARLSDFEGDIGDFVVLDDERVLQTVGIYRYHHPLEDAPAYQARLVILGQRIAEMVKGGAAIERSTVFAFNNSLAMGRRMTDDLARLMLRAYNAEADNSIRTLRLGNVVTAKKRLEASRQAIAQLGKMMEMHISDGFHALRIEEIELTADWLMKKQEEREAAREERARLREERRVERELADERARLDKERAHLQNALAALTSCGGEDQALIARLAAVDLAIVQNDYRVANIRAGYVYVISNRGAFGEGVVKIGLTRRLEPLERVHELGDASVPFHFDVHALFFSNDAVGLESLLHQHFADRAMNRVNARKEFFLATAAEVREVLLSSVGNLLEFTEHAEATEYFQSMKYWPDVADRMSGRARHG